MTVRLTNPPRDGTRPARWRVALARPVALSRRHAAALCAAVEHEWPAALLAACALFACAVAAISANAPERLWGTLAAGAYGLAALAALAGRRRGWPLALAISMAGAVALPLAWMAVARTGQPEVGVVIRSAGMFLHRGTPYQGASAIAASHDVNAYNPYLPALAVFGIPRALVGAGVLTDPRTWFGVVFVLGFGWALKLSGVGRPWVWTAAVTASPIIAYPLSTGGDDLPVLALLCLGLALLRPGRPPAHGWQPDGAAAPRGLTTTQVLLGGAALGLAAAMKATAWPAVAVAAALVAARGGWRSAGWLALAALGVPLAADGPVLVAQPGPVATNTILFPLGLTKIKTPAASALPGHLIAQAWPWGHWAAIALVLAGGLAIAAWLVIRPPRDEAAAGWRLVTGLVVMFAFAPATRFGYLVYPLGLACWLLLARFAGQRDRHPGADLAPATLRPDALGG
jgi:Glycosyltransferase family 87